MGESLGADRRRFPLWPMGVLALVNFVDQVDTAILRGVLPILEDEWSLSDLQLGLLGFAFVFVNALATVPAGWLADHTRRTRLIGWTLLSWSGLIVLSATAVNYLNLLAARAVMGIGQSVDDPASTSLLGDYYPSRLRARAFSLQQISLFVGGGIGLALGGYVGTTLGWRWAFALVGMPGSVVALLAFRLREPVRGESDLPEGATVEAADPQDDQSLGQFARRARAELGSELRMIFGIRTMRYILVGVAALLFTVSGIGYWLAVYHQRYSDMSVGEATAFTALVLGVGGGIGTLVGGIASDRLHRRVTGGRILLVVWSSVACALLFLVSFSIQPVPLRLALQFFGVMAAAGAVPGLRASMLDVVPAESRGVGASAFALTAAVFGTALAPPLVGLLSDLTSLVGAFYIVFPPVILGLLLLLRARHTVDADADALVAALVARSSAAAG
ncbi:MAG: MFS transporter [Actinomycetota bacterium]|nr:MFS transporter [Actinomycetota bacterium]